MCRRCVLLALLALLALPAGASADSADARTTASYLHADYVLVHAANVRLKAAEARLHSVLTGVQRQCPGAAAGSPEDGESTELSNELIGAMVLNTVSLFDGEVHTYLRAVSHLRWHNGPAERAVHEYVSHLHTMIDMRPPALCADVRAWAADGFSSLDGATRSFAPHFMDVWVSLGEQPAALVRIEQPAVRALAHRAAVLEEKISEFEARAVETYTALMNTLQLWP